MISVGDVIEKTVTPHVHAFVSVIEEAAASCVAKAYVIKQCTCGETEKTETGELAPDNHAGNIITVGARAATATQGGYTGDKICTACGKTVETGTFTDPTDPGHVHSFETVIEEATATCISKAYVIKQCACGETEKTETGEIDPDNHVGEMKTYGYHAATETADGYSGDKVCAACGNLMEIGHVLEHTGTTIPDTPATPDQQDTNGGSNPQTHIPFLDWLRSFLRKIISMFKFNFNTGDGKTC